MKAIAATCGLLKISLTVNLLIVTDGMALDLGAVGKGYTADRIADTLLLVIRRIEAYKRLPFRTRR